MGLCKCPKRKVTNLFCFEHRVNVCESCLVSGHQKCIVQSYLQWLQDSDYSPDCPLCRCPLAARDTVRLVCYDVFHWSCLSGRARALPPRTAPGGHRCPTCGGPLFPPPNLEGPVATALRARLATATWARPGLGLPLIEDSEATSEPETPDGIWDGFGAPEPPPPPPPLPHSVVHMGGETPPTHTGSAPRKPLVGRESRALPDRDEDKYRRRLPHKWLPHKWLPHSLRCRRPPPRPALLFGAVMALLLLLLLGGGGGLTRGGSDPALDPLNNPHIRVGP
ncbi:zinc finger protein-like 1 isoform X2 [Cuculus canorus]|uniref:zinc finger protein-like 1 isoform X1 n=1 Tax=Cuculus canorus TaxID=55661 RepID=UPI0023AAA341|nr:zinc finger protein-like 1 isoform X1 [Cuculus canorus]XP_053908487.1 zinc finger protein-like 1 isoform X1 [Cuculus canorus]XP_053908488.1 zinc finger protein-like 1 isoform X2 [Cuculus canorus]